MQLQHESIAIFGGVVFGRHHQTPPFPCAPVHRLHDINHLLFIIYRPVDLIVVTCTQINHYVLVPKEVHHRARVVQLVHLVKVRHLRDVDQVHHGVVLDLVADPVERLVHLHAGGVPVVTEADDDDAILLTEDGLVDLPAVVEMAQHVRHLDLVRESPVILQK